MKTIITIITLLTLPLSAQAFTNRECIANALYYEAYREPIRSQRAVYDVIMHRALGVSSACLVVLAKGQFSWVRIKPMRKMNKQLRELLENVEGQEEELSDASYQYFFVKSLHPKWAKRMKCVVIGRHKYCRKI